MSGQRRGVPCGQNGECTRLYDGRRHWSWGEAKGPQDFHSSRMALKLFPQDHMWPHPLDIRLGLGVCMTIIFPHTWVNETPFSFVSSYTLWAPPQVLCHLHTILGGRAKHWGERVGDRPRRETVRSLLLCLSPSLREGQTWEVKNPKQWLIQKAFLFGFEMHSVTAGSSSSRFTFLIRQIFKWVGTPWMHVTNFQDHVKEILPIFILISPTLIMYSY